MNRRENLLKAYTFQVPQKIPINMHINLACWDYYDKNELEKLILNHKILFPDYKLGLIDFDSLPFAPWRRAGVRYTDSWGCIWETNQSGITGTVVKRPLKDWSEFDSFVPPDPEFHNGWGQVDWDKIEKNIEKSRQKGEFVSGSLRHGHLFLTLEYLRGYENLIYDIYDENPNLLKLINMIENFSAKIVNKYIEFDVDMVGFPEDLGTQNSPLISPKDFRKYIKPVYQRLMSPVKQNNKLVHMHSDGYIMDLIDDLIECGVDIINLQDLVNDIDNLKEHVKGRLCIDLDVDRQNVTRFGSVREIDDLIREEVEKLGSKEGGLTLNYGLYPGTPLKKVKAVMEAMEKYSFYYS